jgi:cell division protein FtsL
MIRIVNIIALAITVTVAFGLYKLKYNTTLAAQTLSRLESDTAAEREAIKVLNAEWSHLNSPQRIEELARKHLTLQDIEKGQMIDLQDVPFRPLPESDDLAATHRSTSETDNTRGGNADG